MNVEVFNGDINELRNILGSWKDSIPQERFSVVPDFHPVMFRLKMLMNSQDCDVLALKSGKGRILGFMGVVASPSALDGNPQAEEHFFYILPEHRGIGGVKMIKAAEEWARGIACKYFLLTASKLANAKHQRVEKFYTKMGYVPFETVYIKEL